MSSIASSSPPPEASAVSISISDLGLESQASSSVQLSSSVISQKRDRSSYIWSHMPGPINTIYTNSQNVVVWRCALCGKEYRINWHMSSPSSKSPPGILAPSQGGSFDSTIALHISPPSKYIILIKMKLFPLPNRYISTTIVSSPSTSISSIPSSSSIGITEANFSTSSGV